MEQLDDSCTGLGEAAQKRSATGGSAYLRPGSVHSGEPALLLPIRDTELTDEQIASANLLPFGDLKSHATIAQIAEELPLTLTRSGVIAGNRTYAGPSINYVFTAPNPLNPNRYVVVSRGYLSVGLTPYSSSPSTVGKDLEALPFFWPDYVIWDANRKPAPTVQSLRLFARDLSGGRLL